MESDPSSSSRPITTKPRGICKYYKTPRGCFAGNRCKFSHSEPGEPPAPSPHDLNKTCFFYAQGYCKRGAQCWFKHQDPSPSSSMAGPAASTSGDTAPPEDSQEPCCICFEQPSTYGLLIGCSHVFCIECIRSWRSPANKSTDVVISGIIKKCPYCRAESRFITPSSKFYPEGSPGKADTIQRYKESMARVPCRYFEQSPKEHRFCPFGKDCFYRHANQDGTPYVFDQGVEHYLPIYQCRQRFPYSNINEFFFSSGANVGESGNAWEDIRQAVDAIRASLFDPATPDGEEGGQGQFEGGGRLNVDMLERLADQVLASLAGLSQGDVELAMGLAMGHDDDDDDDNDDDDDDESDPESSSEEEDHSSPYHPNAEDHDPPVPPLEPITSDDDESPNARSPPQAVPPTRSFDFSAPSRPSGLPSLNIRLPALRPISRHASYAPTPASTTPGTPSPGSGLTTPSSLRFSTIVGSGFGGGRERGRLVIDLECDDEDEDDQEVVEEGEGERRERVSYEDVESPPLGFDGIEEAVRLDVGSVAHEETRGLLGMIEGAESFHPSTPAQAEGEVGGEVEVDSAPSRPEIQYHPDPPFLSDGRGRVVWSSPRGRGGRDRDRGK